MFAPLHPIHTPSKSLKKSKSRLLVASAGNQATRHRASSHHRQEKNNMSPQKSLPKDTDAQEDWSQITNRIAERSQRLMTDFVDRNASDPSKAMSMGIADARNIGGAFLELTAKLMADPHKMMDAQLSLWRDYTDLWRNTALKMMGHDTEPSVEPDGDERRFKDEAWKENQIFDFIKQPYLRTSRWVESTVADVEELDPRTQCKVAFYTKQFVDAIAHQFCPHEPGSITRHRGEQRRKSLKGLENLLQDLEKGKG